MSKKRILVVDDEQLIRELYAAIFIKAGYTVLTAASAEEALEIQKVTPSAVMFLDLNLPGMNGVELCRQVRKDWPMTIPYAVTGYGTLFELTECRDAGFEDYFTKPTRKSTLLEAAEHAFNKLERWKTK